MFKQVISYTYTLLHVNANFTKDQKVSKIFLATCFCLNSLSFATDGDEKHRDEYRPLPTLQSRSVPAEAFRDKDIFTLVLDGGGVRGAFTAAVLQQLEREMAKVKEGACIADLFQHGITGTSTGSFIALGLTCSRHRDEGGEWQEGPYSAVQLVEIYRTLSAEIFDTWTHDNFMKNMCEGGAYTNLLSKIVTCFGCFACCKNCNGFCGPRYSNKKLRAQLTYYFIEDAAHPMTIGQANPPVQVVTFDVDTNEPIYITNYSYPNITLVDAALASSAAPTYFPAVRINDGDGSYLNCVDGGLHDNSAALAAMRFASEIIAYTDDISPRDIGWDQFNQLNLLSVGTGREVRRSRFKVLERAGKLTWASHGIDVAMSGSVAAARDNLAFLFRRRDNQGFYRIQIELDRDEAHMDDSRYVETLIKKGKGCVHIPNYQAFLFEVVKGKFASSFVEVLLSDIDERTVEVLMGDMGVIDEEVDATATATATAATPRRGVVSLHAAQDERAEDDDDSNDSAEEI